MKTTLLSGGFLLYIGYKLLSLVFSTKDNTRGKPIGEPIEFFRENTKGAEIKKEKPKVDSRPPSNPQHHERQTTAFTRMRLQWKNSPDGYLLQTYLPTIICVVALCLAVPFDWPYAYYVLLRLGVCAVSLYWVVESAKQGRGFWCWAFGANAFLFNPIFPVRMARSDWQIVNVIDAVFLAGWTFWAYAHGQKEAE
jgi:hypothetical protein